MKRSVPILMYHHVSPDREITPAAFEHQMKALLDQDYESLSLDDLVRAVRGEVPWNPRGFVVTFDDGYFDNWAFAYPILEKLRIQATMFLVTSQVETRSEVRAARLPFDSRSGERQPGGFVSWTEARAMAASRLVAFGSHTRSHRDWKRSQPYSDLEAELRDSKQQIESELKAPCYHLAWPWGDYETEWRPLLERFGYRSALTTRSGANYPGMSPYALQRVKVSRPSAEWLLGRLKWSARVWSAEAYGFFHGWDRRLKEWWKSESPYSHG